MSVFIQQFQQYRDRIPEFIVKLYHILESKEYGEYICWHGEGEVLIKSGKKLQERVLPHFFRHKHLSSFIRQLNMYKFGKVNKLTKEKHHMFFRNEHFRRGHIAAMTAIRRNNKKNQQQQGQQDRQEEEEHNSDVSINQQLEDNTALMAYKQYVRTAARDIAETLKKMEGAFPQAKEEVGRALGMCRELMEVPEFPSSSTQPSFEECLQNKNMLSTMRLLPRIESLVFPSQYSFCHFG